MKEITTLPQLRPNEVWFYSTGGEMWWPITLENLQRANADRAAHGRTPKQRAPRRTGVPAAHDRLWAPLNGEVIYRPEKT